MRTYNISQMTLTYPEYLVFSEDNNFIQLYAANCEAQMIVTLGDYQQIYYGETEYVVMDLTKLFKRYGSYNTEITLTAYISQTNPTYSTTLSLTFYVVKGRTLADRYHASGRKILLPPFAENVELLADEEASASDDNNAVTVNTAQIITFPVESDTTVEVKNPNEHLRGWLISEETTAYQFYTVELMDCIPQNGAVISWLDIDGCQRFAPCKILSSSSEVEQINYNDGLQMLRTPANRLVSGLKRTIEVGIVQVHPDIHLEEIVFSPEIRLINADGGSSIPLAPDFTEYTGSREKIEDVTLKFTTQQ